jgi:hypothetical protein
MPILGVVASSRLKYPAPAYWAIIYSGNSPTLNAFYTYGGGNFDTNGNYYIAGFMDVQSSDRRGWFIRTDNSGNYQSSLSYRAPGGGCVIAGQSQGLPKSNVDSSGNSYLGISGVAAIGGTSAALMKISNTGSIVSQIGLKSVHRSTSNDYTYNQVQAVDLTNSKLYWGLGVPNSSGSSSSGLHGTVVKMDMSYNIEWQKAQYDAAVGASTRSWYTHGVLFDSSQNVYALSYGQNTSSGYETEWIKYNSSGTVQWQRRFIGPSSAGSRLDLFFGSAITPAGDYIYAAGYYRNNSGGFDTWLSKIDTSTGTSVWNRAILQNISAGSRYTSPREVVIDSNGNVYVCGFWNSASYKSFIAKYNSSGTIQWIRSIDTGTPVGQGLDIDQNGTLTFSAYINGGQYPMYLRVPNDGSKTGNYNTGLGFVNYYNQGSELYDGTSEVQNNSGALTVANGDAQTFTGWVTTEAFTPTTNKVVIS